MDITQVEKYGSDIGLVAVFILAILKTIKDRGYLSVVSEYINILKSVFKQDNNSVMTKLSLSDEDMQVLEAYASDESGKIDMQKLKSIIETYEKINRILEKNENCRKNPDKALTVIHKMINESKK
jgi:exopolysaccharide biosynthesis protein